jgi:hypothetical protein
MQQIFFGDTKDNKHCCLFAYYCPVFWQNVFFSDYSIFLFAEREKLVLLTRNCRTHLLNYLNHVAGIAFA